MTDAIRLQFPIQSLSCASCVGRAEAALAAVPGVEQAMVNLATRQAEISGPALDAPSVRSALAQAGYPAVEQTVTLDIDGMTCASCAHRAETALQAIPGVLKAEVNFATRTSQIALLGDAVVTGDLIRVLSAIGYEARIQSGLGDRSDTAETEIAQARRVMLLSALLTLPVFVLEMGGHLIPPFHHWVMATLGMQMSWLFQFALTTAVLIGPGLGFFRRGLPALFKGTPDMNSLVALGALAAWSFSTVALFWPAALPTGARAVYFEAAAVIVTLILTGRWLEARARGRTGAAIRELIGLQPRTAQREIGGAVEETSIELVQVGDVLHIRPGERIPVDGTLLTGDGFIDESMVTGEAVPVRKGPGGWITGGTVNGTAALRMQAQKVGRDTLLAQIIQMVQQAQGAKLPVQALVDRIVGVFVPIVLAVAVLTVIAWLAFGPTPALSHALVAGVAVLIIACPCAMGLATPTSIMVGTGRAAEMGVLFRKGGALQTLGQTQVMVFDKTGTLTQGRPVVVEQVTAPGFEPDDVLRLVAAAETQSEHPLSRAILAHAERQQIVLPAAEQAEAVVGYGVRARVEGRRVLVGALRLMAREDVPAGPLSPALERIERSGATPVAAALDGQIAAVFGITDPIKPGARAVLDGLRAEGLQLAMVTGDAVGTARAIADELDIAHVEAEVLPGDKRAAVARLRSRHGAVTFVGDGINDAPALAEADTGIAMGTGTDVAIESADVVLMSGDLSGVANALNASRATMRNIRQNLFWAFAYNTLLIPVAAGVAYPFTGLLLSPMLAAGAMALSSVFVLGNALRLRHLAPRLSSDGAGQLIRPMSPQPAGNVGASG